MSTNLYGDRTSETQNGSLRLSSLSTKNTLRSISLLFEAIKRLNVSRCGSRISIAPLTRSRSKANTDRSPVTRLGKSSRIRRVGHPIDMETDIGVASWSLLDGRPPYSEYSRTGKDPYRRFFIDISKTDKSRKLEFCIAKFRPSSVIFRDDERTNDRNRCRVRDVSTKVTSTRDSDRNGVKEKSRVF